jgi:hypothetical protein
MPELEIPSMSRRARTDSSPRHPHREIADFLATAITRARIKTLTASEATEWRANSEVCLGFSAHQSVHTNPSYAEGVHE